MSKFTKAVTCYLGIFIFLAVSWYSIGQLPGESILQSSMENSWLFKTMNYIGENISSFINTAFFLIYIIVLSIGGTIVIKNISNTIFKK